MILLDTTTRTLQVLLAGAKATNDCPVVASYVDIAQTGFAMQNASASVINTNGVTAVTAVAAPSSGNSRQLKYLSVQNADTAPVTVIVRYNDNATTYVIVRVTLQVNEALTFDAEFGWAVYATSGSLKSGGAAAGATAQSSVASPTAPNSTANFTMQALAGSITPKTTGNILITISGTIISSAALVDQGIIVQISYGTGAAPTANAALTGTQVGAQQQWTNLVAATAAADVHVPFSVTAVVSSLVLGTAYWLDLAAKAVTTASVQSLSGVSISAIEF